MAASVPRARLTVRWLMGAVALLALLMVPVRLVDQAREDARRAQCVCNFKSIGLALHNYHSVYGSLPTGAIPNPGLPPERRLGWLVECWPMVGTLPGIDESKGWDQAPNWPLTMPTPGEATCPSAPGGTGARPMTLVGIAGLGADAPALPAGHPRAGVFGYDRVTRFADITDGTAGTVMLIETSTGHAPWTAGGPSSVRGVDPAARPYIGPGRPFGGYHPAGATALFADGSVRLLRNSIDPRVLEGMSTIAGGEALPAEWDR